MVASSMTYEEAVETLVQSWREDTIPPVEVWEFPDPGRELVRLLVVTDTVPETGDTSAIHVGPGRDFRFESRQVLITPSEWQKVQDGKLKLPDGWDLESARKAWPS